MDLLAPFLRYLYCEPQRLPEHALLRHGLLRVLLPPSSGDPAPPSAVRRRLLLCLLEMLPRMQVRPLSASPPFSFPPSLSLSHSGLIRLICSPVRIWVFSRDRQLESLIGQLFSPQTFPYPVECVRVWSQLSRIHARLLLSPRYTFHDMLRDTFHVPVWMGSLSP